MGKVPVTLFRSPIPPTTGVGLEGTGWVVGPTSLRVAVARHWSATVSLPTRRRSTERWGPEGAGRVPRRRGSRTVREGSGSRRWPTWNPGSTLSPCTRVYRDQDGYVWWVRRVVNSEGLTDGVPVESPKGLLWPGREPSSSTVVRLLTAGVPVLSDSCLASSQ